MRVQGVKCGEVKVEPGVVLAGRQIEHPDPVVAAAALALPQPVDGWLIQVDGVPPVSPVVLAYLRDQPFRDRLVAVPSGLAEGPHALALRTDIGPAVELADSLGMQVQVPPGSQPSARTIPVDDQGLATSTDRAVALRVLPRAHMAARHVLQWALGQAGVGQILPFLSAAAEIHRSWGPIPEAAYALAVYFVRYGVPPGWDTATRRRSIPPTAGSLHAVLGSRPEPMDPAAVRDRLAAEPPGSALLVQRRTADRTQELVWLAPADDGDGWWWLPAATQTDPAPTATPVTLDTIGEVLAGSDGRVLIVDPAGQASAAETYDAALELTSAQAFDRWTDAVAELERARTAREDARAVDERRAVAGWQARREAQADLTDLGRGTAFLDPTGEFQMTQRMADAVQADALDKLARFWDGHEVSAGSRASIERDMRELTTLQQLSRESYDMNSPSGSPYVLGDGDDAVRATFWLHLERIRGPRLSPIRPEEREGEVRAFHDTKVSDTQVAGNGRVLSLPLTGAIGLAGKAGKLRALNPAVNPSVTHNQYQHVTATDQGVGHNIILRLREPHYPHQYRATWTIQIGSASDPVAEEPASPPDPGTVDRPDDLVTVMFPEHIARPPGPVTKLPGTAEQRAKDFGWQPVVLLDRMHDPYQIWRQLRHRLPELDNLRPDSQRALLLLIRGPSLKGGMRRLRSSGLLSQPLFDRRGEFVGILRLQAASVTPQRNLTKSGESRAEVYRDSRVAESGSASLTNSRELSAGLGATLIGAPLGDTVTYGEYSSGLPSAQVRVATEMVDAYHSGGSASLMQGWDTGLNEDGKQEDAHIDDADVLFTATLVGVAGSTVVSWYGYAKNQQGARVRWVPVKLAPANPEIYPPAGVEHGGGSSGYADFTGFDLAPMPPGRSADEQAQAWLLAEGFLGADPLQVRNLKHFLEVTAADFRESHWNRLTGGGIWASFERVTSGNTVKRAVARWWLDRTGSADHAGSTRGVRLLFGAEGDDAFTASRTAAELVAGQVKADVTIGTKGAKVPAVPVSIGPFGYQAQRSHRVPTGPTVSKQVIFESPPDGVHAFDLGGGLFVQIFYEHDNTPVLDSRQDVDGPQRAKVRGWVPDMLVRRERAPDPGVPSPRPVTEDDLAALNAPIYPQYKWLHTVTTVGGSAALDKMFHDLVVKVFRPAGQSMFDWARGSNPANHASMSAAARRVFTSPEKLRHKLGQMLTAKYVKETGEEGALGLPELQFGLQAYLGRPRYVPPDTSAGPQVGYVEWSVGITETVEVSEQTERSGQGGGRAGIWATAGDSLVGFQAGPQRDTSNSTHAARKVDATDGRTHTQDGKMYTLTVPATFVGDVVGANRNAANSVRAAFGEPVADTKALAVDVPDAVVAHLSFSQLVDVWRWRAASRDPGGIDGIPTELAELLDKEMELRESDERARRNHETPTGKDVRYPPRRTAGWLGLGDAVVPRVWLIAPGGTTASGRPGDTSTVPVAAVPRVSSEISAREARDLGLPDAKGPAIEMVEFAGADPVPDRSPHPATTGKRAKATGRALYEHAVAEAEAKVPGLTRPGSNTYMPGVLAGIAAMCDPDFVTAAAPAYFRARSATGPVPLAVQSFVTTMHAGAIRVTVALWAQPAPEFDTFDQTRKIFGRTATGAQERTGIPAQAGLETHGMVGQGRARGSEQASATSGSGPVQAFAADPLVRGNVPQFPMTAKASGAEDVSSADGKRTQHTVRNYKDMVDAFPFPAQLAVTVVREPVEASPINAVGPTVAAAGRKLAERYGWLPRPEGPVWVDAIFEVQVPTSDTTSAPVSTEWPAWYQEPVTVADPTIRYNDPTSGYPELPDLGDEPPASRVSWFNGGDLLAELVKQVLPGLANTSSATDVDQYLAGPTSEVVANQLLRKPATELTFRTVDPYALRDFKHVVRIEPVAATGWQPSTDQIEGHPGSIVVGEGSASIIEQGPVHSSAVETGAARQRSAEMGFTGLSSVYVKKDQAGEKFGHAPGNISYLNPPWLPLAASGGPGVRGGSGASSGDRRIIRLPGRDADAHRDNTANELAHRTVLFRVSGTDYARFRGAKDWGVASTGQRWMRAMVESRVPGSALVSGLVTAWLAQGNGTDSQSPGVGAPAPHPAEQFLRQHQAQLLTTEVGELLSKMVASRPADHRLRAYQVIWQLAHRAGEVGDQTRRRRPVAPASLANHGADPTKAGPLRAMLAIDFLAAQPSRQWRLAWYAMLLEQLYRGALTTDQSVTLVLACDDPEKKHSRDDREANSTLFRFVGELLSMSEVGKSEQESLLRYLNGCRLDPFDKMIWIRLLQDLSTWLSRQGRSQHADMAAVAHNALADCDGSP